MSLLIDRSSTQFEYGIDSPEQMQRWLERNPNAIGACFVGRSNVGKSSLINSLFGNSTARTSKTPGRTRQINIFSFKLASNNQDETEELPKLYCLDLPGYGHAAVSHKMSQNWEELLGTLFNKYPLGLTLINIQDARHPNQKSDVAFHQYLQSNLCETFLVFNKLDKLKTQKLRSALNKQKPSLFKQYKWVKQIHFVSAEKNTGVTSLHDSLISRMMLMLNFQE